MTASRPALERRILAAVDATLRAFRSCSATSARGARSCSTACASVSARRSASTSTSSAARRRRSVSIRRSPTASPFRVRRAASRRRRATRSTRRLRSTWRFSIRPARRRNEPATFLLDEVLELRTFESFPGLRTALRELLKTLGQQRQPVRPDDPLCLTRPSAAEGRDVALRGHSRAAAVGRRSSRPAAVDRRRADAAAGRSRIGSACARRARAVGRPRRLRAGDRRSAEQHGRRARRRRSGQRAHAPAVARRPARVERARVLRAAPASRARIRRAESDPRDPRAGRAADAHRSGAAAETHARARRRTTCRGWRMSI